MGTSDYNFIAKTLHRIVLGSKSVSEISFDIERTVYSSNDSSQITDGKHVFVCGLARSGTTALMTYLHKTTLFASLTYADMPFVLAPNLWNKLSFGKSNKEYKERAHKDGIFVNAESPEAFDEVFWKVFLNDVFVQQDRLLLNDIPSDTLKLYSSYIELILKKYFKGHKLRYLSKNNNTILRLDSILRNFPKSYVIIPFRDPLQHSISLLNQHQNFCELQNHDPFTLDYMTWIGHYEFGLNQKPFFLNNDIIFSQMHQYKKDDINFWLLTWLNYYSYVLKNYADTCILFSYELFCREPNSAMSQLLKKIDSPAFDFELIPFELKNQTSININEQILNECQTVYTKLNEIVSDTIL
jgi:hypothetical protein